MRCTGDLSELHALTGAGPIRVVIDVARRLVIDDQSLVRDGTIQQGECGRTQRLVDAANSQLREDGLLEPDPVIVRELKVDQVPVRGRKARVEQEDVGSCAAG